MSQEVDAVELAEAHAKAVQQGWISWQDLERFGCPAGYEAKRKPGVAALGHVKYDLIPEEDEPQ